MNSNQLAIAAVSYEYFLQNGRPLPSLRVVFPKDLPSTGEVVSFKEAFFFLAKGGKVLPFINVMVQCFSPKK